MTWHVWQLVAYLRANGGIACTSASHELLTNTTSQLRRTFVFNDTVAFLGLNDTRAPFAILASESNVPVRAMEGISALAGSPVHRRTAKKKRAEMLVIIDHASLMPSLVNRISIRNGVVFIITSRHYFSNALKFSMQPLPLD